METAKLLGDARSHGFVECVPVPPKVAAKAPLYFKKGIDDAESEWAQHHAKRWIDTSAKVQPHHCFWCRLFSGASGQSLAVDMAARRAFLHLWGFLLPSQPACRPTSLPFFRCRYSCKR